MLGSFFIKVTDLNTCNFIKERLRHRYFLVNIAKYLRTPDLKKILERLLLDLSKFHHRNSRAKRSNDLRCFLKKGILRNFAKLARKHLCQSLFFNKVAGLSPAALLKKKLWHRCFPVNFAKFLRTSY